MNWLNISLLQASSHQTENQVCPGHHPTPKCPLFCQVVWYSGDGYKMLRKERNSLL